VEFLKEPHAAVVSTVRSDGAPYSAATWYDWADGRILVNMDSSGCASGTCSGIRVSP
jgi:Pyridoxamine 5'-phosphate oxidase